jgi:hypothetical protein
MPITYVNWGRYVQLAGQVVLPVALWLSLGWLETPVRDRKRLFLASLAVAGLLLSHYRISLFYILFLPVAWLGLELRASGGRRGSRLLRFMAVPLLALALALPWIWHLSAGLLPNILGEFARSTAPAAVDTAQRSLYADLSRFVPYPLLLAALLGILAGALKRQTWTLLTLLWIGLLLLVANLDLLGLPGTGVVSNIQGALNNFTLLIGLYMPVSILGGYLGSSLIDVLRGRWPRGTNLVSTAMVLLLSLLGTRQALTIVDRAHTLVTTPDIHAMGWIEAHTPDSATFLANFFFAYQDHVIVGSDAGWWIPLLAHRANTVPPITYGHEAAYDPGYIAQVNGLARYLEEHPLDAADTVQVLKENEISHVYVGTMGGNLPLDVMQASPAYVPVYHRDRVWIFEIR